MLLTCTDSENKEVEVVAKLSAGCDRGTGGLVAEALSAMVAADLDLPIPEPFLVVLEPDFVDAIPDGDAAAMAKRSSSIAFGLRKLPPGFTVWPTGKTVPKAQVSEASEVFSFDVMVQNPDRRPDNPNCFSDGRSLAILDHELTLMLEGIIGWIAPWELGGADTIGGRHVFFSSLAGSIPDLDRLAGAWRALTNDRLDDYRRAIPAEWTNGNNVLPAALPYLRRVRDEVVQVVAELKRSLQ